MTLKMRGNRIGVERLGKSQNNETILAMPEDTNSMGIVKFVGDSAPDDLKPGMKVCFGNKREPITIKGKEILVMDEDNVVAIVEE